MENIELCYTDPNTGKHCGISKSFIRWKTKYNTGRTMRRRYKKKMGGTRYRFRKYNKPTVSQLQKQISNLKSGKTGKEWKTHDTELVSTAIPNDGTQLVHLTDIDQGNRSLDREGLKINIQSIWIKMFLTTNVTHNTAHEIRTILFIDKGNHNGDDPPTVDVDLLEGTDVLDFTEHKIKGRYKILWDKVTVINPNVSAMQKVVYKKYYKKFKRPKKVFYNDTEGTEEGKGQFWLLAISNTATNEPRWSWKARMKFTE